MNIYRMQMRFFTFLPCSWCKTGSTEPKLGLESACNEAKREGRATPALMATPETCRGRAGCLLSCRDRSTSALLLIYTRIKTQELHGFLHFSYAHNQAVEKQLQTAVLGADGNCSGFTSRLYRGDIDSLKKRSMEFKLKQRNQI